MLHYGYQLMCSERAQHVSADFRLNKKNGAVTQYRETARAALTSHSEFDTRTINYFRAHVNNKSL